MTCPSWVTLHGMAHSFIELGAGAVAVRHWSHCEEIPHVQWQRSTSRTVEGGEIAFRIKPHTHQSCSEVSNKPCSPKELLTNPNQTQKAILCAKPDSKGDIPLEMEI